MLKNTSVDDAAPSYELVDLPTLQEIKNIHSIYTQPITEDQLVIYHTSIRILVRVLVIDGEKICDSVEVPAIVAQEKNSLRLTPEEFNQLQRDKKQLDNLAIYRFLRGFEFKYEESTRLMVKMLNWRAQYQPEKIRYEEFMNTTAPQNMLLDLGYATNGMPLLYLWTSRDKIENNEENKQLKFRHLVYIYERIIDLRVKDESIQVNFIVDAGSISLSLVKNMVSDMC